METEESSFEELQKDITAALVQTTKSAGLLANEDLNFLRTSDLTIAKALDSQTSRLLTTIRRLTRCATKDTELTAPAITKSEDLEDNWNGIVEIIDNLLEKADRCLDEYSGRVTKTTVPEPSDTSVVSRPRTIPRAENIIKPQQFFANPPQNDLTNPFKPLLKTKPFATISLEESISTPQQDDSIKSVGSSAKTGAHSATPRSFGHPYFHEIKNYRYPRRVYEKSEPIPSQPYENTTAIWVDTLEGLQEMLLELKKAKEIAIDLEHHDIRTFTGIVCLMQISTRDKDWIVDTLKPWREDLQLLNEVFADPDIIKVLHGAQMDIIWLQRDLGLYVVGLFDTYFAARSLGYVRHSLAFLLNKFVEFDAQKQYQLADWRTRPLSEEMFSYARSDTHFLLYIYDHMKNELLSKANGGPAMIDDVLGESKKTALQRYERSNYDSELGIGDRGWYGMLFKTPAVFSREQFSVFKAVHQWRDQLARKEDESPQYLISATALFNIARDMPTTMPLLQSHLNRRVDALSRKVSELLKVIQDAKTRGVDGPDMKDFMSGHPAHVEYLSRKAARNEAYNELRQAEQQTRSVAEVAKQELTLISGDDLRAAKSLFWGSAMHSPKHRRVDTEPTTAQFQIPLPNFTAEVFAVDGELPEDPSKSQSLPEHPYIKSSKKEQENNDDDNTDDVFILKEKSGSRKRKAKHQDINANSHSANNSTEIIEADSIALEEEQDDENAINGKKISGTSAKTARKRARRERRRMAEEMAVDGPLDDSATFDESKAFDYANAESVLHAREEAPANKKGKHRTPVLNPYAKSMDAPKGLVKKKKDIQGKSATFRS